MVTNTMSPKNTFTGFTAMLSVTRKIFVVLGFDTQCWLLMCIIITILKVVIYKSAPELQMLLDLPLVLMKVESFLGSAVLEGLWPLVSAV